MDFPHLSAATAAIMLLPDAQRELAILGNTPWFATSHARQVFVALESLLLPASGQPMHLLLRVDAANGMSALLRQFTHQRNEHTSAEQVEHTPVVYIHGLTHLSTQNLVGALLRAMGMDMLADLYPSLVEVGQLLQQRRVRWLMIEGIDWTVDSLAARHAPWVRAILAQCSALGVHVVVGYHPGFVVHADVAASFQKLTIPLWQDGSEWRTLLASYEQHLPLRRASQLASDLVAAKLLTLSKGKLALLDRLLREAAVDAIKTGREQITPNQLHLLAVEKMSDYPPTDYFG